MSILGDQAYEDAAFMDTAFKEAMLGQCTRRRIGAVLLTKDFRIIHGHNQVPKTVGNCLEGDCPRGRLGFDEVPSGAPYVGGVGTCHAIHAEEIVLLVASWEQMDGGTLYVTDRPCANCSRLLAGTPLQRIVWKHPDERGVRVSVPRTIASDTSIE